MIKSKKIMKKLLLLAFVVIGGVMQVSGAKTIYLSAGVWKTGATNETFGVWAWKTSENGKLYEFLAVNGTEMLYSTTIPDECDNVILLRYKQGGFDGSDWNTNDLWNRACGGGLNIGNSNDAYYLRIDAYQDDTKECSYINCGSVFNFWYGNNDAADNLGSIPMTSTNGYEFTASIDNQIAGETYFGKIITGSAYLFPEANSDYVLNFENMGGKLTGTDRKWKINNIKAKFVITLNFDTFTWTSNPSFSRTITDTYSTFSSDYDVAIPSGLKAYYASAKDGNNVTMTKFENGIASTDGAFLKGTAGSYTFTPATTTDVTSTNYLKPGTSGFTGGENYYVFAKQGSDYGFYKYNSSAIDMTGKAYLDLSGAGSRLNIVFADEASSISSVATEISASKVYHDLQGRRVAQPTKGMYIVNGKKMIIK